ncbi:MAG: HAD-IA family hydrolase, partial [Pseudomonadales bacterium]|nr:HAD-IA family hydrolase [Pseudomonadales bacterium]
LSFDCYGTLIDWENGLLGYLRPLLETRDAHVIDEWLLEFHAEAEPRLQAQGGSYRDVLGGVVAALGTRLGFVPSDDDMEGLARSIEYWQPFSDTTAALGSLAKHFDLVALSNIDDDLFAHSARAMGDPFARVITAQQVGAYKPDPRMFKALRKQVQGPILHVAQSRFHDILPAAAAGLDTVWIDRPSLGATRVVEAKPTWTFPSLQDFAAAWQ